MLWKIWTIMLATMMEVILAQSDFDDGDDGDVCGKREEEAG